MDHFQELYSISLLIHLEFLLFRRMIRTKVQYRSLNQRKKDTVRIRIFQSQQNYGEQILIVPSSESSPGNESTTMSTLIFSGLKASIRSVMVPNVVHVIPRNDMFYWILQHIPCTRRLHRFQRQFGSKWFLKT